MLRYEPTFFTQSVEQNNGDANQARARREYQQRVDEYQRLTGKSWAQELATGGPIYSYEETIAMEKNGLVGFKGKGNRY